MGTLSEFGWNIQADRERLCSKLVCKLLPVQAGDANHELAMEYCVQNLEQHRFGDVNPLSVEELYASLSDRLGSHSQLEKQRALSRLVKSLLACQLDSQQLEPQHNVLCLVYWLARRPLDSAYTPPDSEGAVPGTPLSEASEGDPVSEWGDDAAVYSSHSELSEWDASDADSVQDPDLFQVTDPTTPDFDQQPPSPLVLIQQLRQKLAVHLPSNPQHNKLNDGCLLLQVAVAHGKEDVLPAAHHCFSEADLVCQVLRMLRGWQDPGPAFHLDRREGSFGVVPQAHVVHLSQSSLHHLLHTFASAGTALLRLQRFVDRVQAAVSCHPWHHTGTPPSVSTTLAAFAAALADQMRPIWAELVQLEENLHPSEASVQAEPQPQVSLLGLEYQLQGVVWRAGLLGHVLEGAMQPQEQPLPQPITAADLSCSLLTRLEGMLHHYSLQGGPRGSQETAVVLQLLQQSMQPLLASLQAWLYAGLLPASPHNFFICQDQTVSVDSPYFWNDAFALQHTASGQVACPAFLQPLAHGILSTGKSLLLLRAHQDHHRRSSPLMTPWVGSAATPGGVQRQRGTAAEGVQHQRGTVRQQVRQAAHGSLSQRFLRTLRLTVQAPEQPNQLDSNQTLPTAQDASSTIAGTRRSPSPNPSQASSGAQPGSSPSHSMRMRQSQRQGWADASTDPSMSVGQRMKKSQASWLPQPLSACPLTTSAPSAAAYTLPQQAKHAATAELHCPVVQQRSPAQASGQTEASHSADWEPGTESKQASSPPSTSFVQQRSTARQPQQQEQEQEQEQQHSDLLHQQQSEHEQESLLADSAVMEWCSKAEELMQQAGRAEQASPAEEAVPLQSPFGMLQRDLTALPAYSGKGMLSIGSNGQHDQRGDKQWLEGLQAVDLPPVDTLMQACLLQPIQEQIDVVGGVLLQRLLGEWGLMHQLAILRNVFLLGCPLMMPFASALFGRLHKGHRLTSLSHFELEVMLQQSLADLPSHRPGDHALPPPNTLSVELVHQHPSISTPSTGSEARRQGNVVELLPLRLHYKVPWPLSMIVDDAVLLKYNQVLIFLLQIRWAKWSLERARVKAGRGEAGRCLDCADVLAHQLSHFVNTLHQFVMDRLLHGAWLELQQALEGAKSLEEVTTAHSRFVDAVQRQCLLAPDKTWKLIEGVVVQILNQVLQFAELQQKLRKPGTKVSGAEVRQELEQLHINFRDRHRYLLKVLTARTLKISGQSELHYLVMHINFNSFYAQADDMY